MTDANVRWSESTEPCVHCGGIGGVNSEDIDESAAGERYYDRGSVLLGLLIGGLWLGVITTSVAVVWTLPATGDTTALRWFGTGIILLVGLFITIMVTED